MPTCLGNCAPVSPQDIAQAAYNAGFRGQALQEAVAVALTEGNGNVNALNPSAATGDYSIGPWQLNFRNGVNGPIYNRWGLTPDTVAGDLQKQASLAFQLWQGAGQRFSDWSTWNSGAYQHNMFAAGEAVQAVIPGSDVLIKPIGAIGDTSVGNIVKDVAPGSSNSGSTTSDSTGLGDFFARMGLFILALILGILAIVILLRKPITQGAEVAAKS